MTQEQQPPPLSPQEQILGIGVLNALIARAIQVAALYGVADHLQDGPKSAVELAKLTQTHPDALYRLLRALATVGVFEESNTDAPKNGEHHFALTPLSHCLCSERSWLDVRNGAPVRTECGAQILERIRVFSPNWQTGC